MSHAKTLLVLSSALPVSLSPSNALGEQARVLLSATQSGSVVGLLLYGIGFGITVYAPTLTGKEERMRSGSVVATY